MIIHLKLQEESLASVVIHLQDFSTHMMKVLYSRFGKFSVLLQVMSSMFIGLLFCLTDGLILPIIQVSTSDEGRDMWQVYLDMNHYAAALSHCRNQFQRDQVYLVQVFMYLDAETNYLLST